MTSPDPQAPRTPRAGKKRRRVDPDEVLGMLDGAKERHEAAFPGAAGDPVVYFAHLTAIRQLTELYYVKLLKPHAISYSEYRVLSALRIRDRAFRATPHALNKLVRITSAGMTRTLDRLEAAGYIDRTPNPEDRRSVLVGLTRPGWAFAERVARDVGERYAGSLEGMTPETHDADVASFRAVIARLADALGT